MERWSSVTKKSGMGRKAMVIGKCWSKFSSPFTSFFNLNHFSWKMGDVSNSDRTLLSLHRLRGCQRCKAAVGERYASSPLPGVWPAKRERLCHSILCQSTSFSFASSDPIALSLYVKFTPSAPSTATIQPIQPPRRRKLQFLRWLLGSFKLIRFLLRERIFVRMR